MSEDREVEKFEKDGQIFQRYLHDEKDSAHFTKREGPLPDVLCGKCHGEKFTLRYGSYEIRAKCVQCGYEAVVYDG